MSKDEKVRALVDLIDHRMGRAAALGYLTGLVQSYVAEKSIDFHFNRQLEDFAKECGL